MAKRLFNTLLLSLVLATPAYAQESLAPLDFKGLYEFSLSGLLIGKMGIEMEQKPQHYSIVSDIESAGVVNLFARHQSHTISNGSGANFLYPDHIYESRYHTRKKAHYIKLTYKDNHQIAEELVPPENHVKRPVVALDRRSEAADPLQFILKTRGGVHDALAHNQTHFSVNVYDARRLTRADFTIEGKTTLQYGDRKLPVIAVTLHRKPLAGFTAQEQSDNEDKEPPMHIYFSDDGRFLPIKLEVTLWLGTISGNLVKECRSGESCLMGIKE